MAKNISFTIKYWKQNGPKDKGHFDTREMKNIPDDTSFLEMLDILNEELINEGKEPFVFDHDCREGICGMCSLYINGTPHGKTERGATTCQLYMRRFNDGDVITVEPWRSAGFPVIKDCMVDRGAFDKIIQAGGYTSVRTGQAQDANAILIPKDSADEAMDCATCIGCGACVAACKTVRPCSSSVPRSASWPSFPKAVPRLPSAPRLWWPGWTNSVSVTAPTPVPAKPYAPRMRA